MSKKYDFAVAIGEYTDAQGGKKKRYKTIGAIMQGEHGLYMLLDATALSMQLFALANRDRRDSVLVSMFDADRERERGTAIAEPPPDEDIPF
jgi:hypothetical protein